MLKTSLSSDKKMQLASRSWHISLPKIAQPRIFIIKVLKNFDF